MVHKTPIDIERHFKSLKKEEKIKFLNSLKEQDFISFMHSISPDDITDILQLFPKRKQKKYLSKLEFELKDKVEFLLKFNPKSAAGLMSLDYIIVNIDTNIKKIIEKVRIHEIRTGRTPTILVRKDNYILGELRYSTLVLKKMISERDIHFLSKIKYDSKSDVVISTFKKNLHKKVIVLDSDKTVMGIIYSDDIIELIEDRENSSIYKFAGINKEEDVLDSFVQKVKSRWFWLLINLFTAFIAASVVGLFDNIISKYVLLAVYMPIVAGMGGNTGTQSMAVAIRGLTLGEIDSKTTSRVIFNEIFAGAINGIIVGIVVGVVAYLFNCSYLLGVILAISMIINLAVASFFGSIVPIVLKKLGKDPATISTIFITTATDVCGFFVFLGLASMLM